MRISLFLPAILVGLIAAVPAAAAPLTVVELFQSQGCSSCPPANENVMAIAGRPDVLALSFQVTYWDHLGWKDTFASPAYTQRQRDYSRTFHPGHVYTPEVIINGVATIYGSNRRELDTALAKAQRTDAVSLALASDTVRLGEARGQAGRVWLVRYNPNIVQVPIARGENGGRTLPHRNVVVELKLLGEWSGEAKIFALPAAGKPSLRTAVLVQGQNGAILAAARDQ